MNRIDALAPCGIVCTLCSAYQNPKNPCPGCRGNAGALRKSCANCAIRLCGQKKRFCGECDIFPCKPLADLDKRYRLKYHYSPLTTLRALSQMSEEALCAKLTEQYTCPTCHTVQTLHLPHCPACRHPRQIP